MRSTKGGNSSILIQSERDFFQIAILEQEMIRAKAFVQDWENNELDIELIGEHLETISVLFAELLESQQQEDLEAQQQEALSPEKKIQNLQEIQNRLLVLEKGWILGESLCKQFYQNFFSKGDEDGVFALIYVLCSLYIDQQDSVALKLAMELFAEAEEEILPVFISAFQWSKHSLIETELLQFHCDDRPEIFQASQEALALLKQGNS